MTEAQLVKMVQQANNLSELRKAYMSVITMDGLQAKEAYLLIEALYSKAMEIAQKSQAECEEHKRRIQELTPMPMDEILKKEIRREMMGQPPQFIRKTVMEATFDSRNLLRYQEAMMVLAERLETAILAAKIPSQTNTDERLAILRLEAERHALVEALRIVASRGEYDPTAQAGDSGA